MIISLPKFLTSSDYLQSPDAFHYLERTCLGFDRCSRIVRGRSKRIETVDWNIEMRICREEKLTTDQTTCGHVLDRSQGGPIYYQKLKHMVVDWASDYLATFLSAAVTSILANSDACNTICNTGGRIASQRVYEYNICMHM